MKITNQHLAIGIPCSFPLIPFAFFKSFVHLERPDFTLITADNGPIDTLRNDIVAKAKAVEATHLLMTDVDQILHPQTVTRLLSHRLPIVGAVVHRRYVPFDPIMMRLTDKGYESIEDWQEGDLCDVDATGAGCVLYDMQLFHDLDRRARAEIEQFNALRPSPGDLALMPQSTREYLRGLEARCVHPHVPGIYFKFRTHADNGMIIGEDIGLCQDLKAAGYAIHVDTSVPADHLTTLAVNRATNQLYMAMKQKQREALASLALVGHNQDGPQKESGNG